MTLRFSAATLAFLMVGAVAWQPAVAQFGAVPGLSGRPSGVAQGASRPNPYRMGSQAYGNPQAYAGSTPSQASSPAYGRPPAYVANAPAYQQSQPGPTPDPAYQSQPSGSSAGSSGEYYEPQGMIPSEGHYVDDQSMGSYYSDGCSDGYCGDGSYGGVGCGDACGNSGGWGCCSLLGIDCNSFCSTCPPGQFFVTADYLHVRASFSEAVSYLEQDDSETLVGRDTFHQLDFQYESSYRVGGGYRLCGCGDEIRFMFTQFGSNASDIAPSGSFLPYEVSSPPGGQTYIDANVNVRAYDVAFAKTFPLGSPLGGCGDACGCGDGCCGDACGCGPACPAWAVTWSGGFRFADVNWRRSYLAVDADESLTTNADAVMNFRGGGLRMGLEGRRYFFDGGLLSVYLKGDLSLLLGDYDLVSQRTVDGGTAPDINNFQTIHCRHIIPVTEIEAGLTGQITRNATITAGYMLSAWHDLGFRDQFNFPTFMETSYDDANILGFDGYFARLEVAF